MNLRRGFTLAEMAIVVVLIGIAMSMGLKMTTATLDNMAYSEIKAKQERIKTALTAYLRTNGRLPCADVTADPTDASYGLQDRAGGVDSACTVAAAGVATVIPWRDIGLSRNDVVDGWGNFCLHSMPIEVRMKKRLIHTLYLAPAILLLLMWIAAAPSLA